MVQNSKTRKSLKNNKLKKNVKVLKKAKTTVKPSNINASFSKSDSHIVKKNASVLIENSTSLVFPQDLKDDLQQKAVKTINSLKIAHKKMNIPNMLTLFRIWAIPAIVFTFFFDTATAAWIGVLLFMLAGVSDYMDGYLARHLNQLSRFGRVLDPIADKLLVGSILLMLAFTARLGDYGIIPAVVILCREILVSGLREFLAEIKVGCPVTRLAKWKTACQMLALPMLMVSEPGFSGFLSDVFYYIGHLALWGAALLTVMTGYDYWKSGRKYMDD